MEYEYTPLPQALGDRILERLLELLPGLITWVTILGLGVFSIVLPSVAAAIMVTFLYYWILRILYWAVFMIVAFGRLWAEQNTDWMARIRDLYTESDGSDVGEEKPRLAQRISLRLHRQVKRAIGAGTLTPPDFDRLYNVVIIPVYNESPEVFESGVEAIRDTSYPNDRMLLVLATEERSPEPVKEAAKQLRIRFSEEFADVLVTEHPADIPGEARVKGANATYAARQVAAYLDEHGIAYEDVIVSCFDADTVPGPDYFGCLTYTFLTTPERKRASFQPIPLYDNNIWRVPFYARVLEMGSTVFQMIESTNHDLLVSFSSHSMSFRALVDAGYWPVDLIPDDSAIYWKSFIKFDGDFRVVPIPTTLSMDASEAPTFWQTCKNTYKQKLRWAWGVENVPIAGRGIIRNPRLRRTTKIKYITKLFDTYFVWATWPFLLAIYGWFPMLMGYVMDLDAIALFNLGRISALIFQLATANVLLMIGTTAFLLFRTKPKVSLRRKLLYPVEWVLLPVITLFFSGLPALHAQTRLMLRKPLDFWTSEKMRGEAEAEQSA